MYFSQLCVWLVVTIVAKLIMLAVLKITEKFLENFIDKTNIGIKSSMLSSKISNDKSVIRSLADRIK